MDFVKAAFNSKVNDSTIVIRIMSVICIYNYTILDIVLLLHFAGDSIILQVWTTKIL